MKYSNFSDEIMHLIEAGELEKASQKAHEEIMVLWGERQREKIKIAKGWLKT